MSAGPVSSLDHHAVAGRLTTDDLRVEGRMPWSSNATFLVSLGTFPEDESEDESEHESEHEDAGGLPHIPDGAIRGIYKPGRGERPLWDFPRGLYRREIAAYELTRFLGWDVVPPTVLRDADYGPGSLQFFIDTDFTSHYFTFLENESFHPQLRRMAAFDVIANNTDRKGGHVLADAAGHLWGIDNGLCFNEEPKLRTVIWDFAGESLPRELRADIERFTTAGPGALGALCSLLSNDEISAAQQRAVTLLDKGELPAPRSDHAYPWPLV